MSISNVTSNPAVSQPGWRSTVNQARDDFAQLFQAMQAGNLSNAQQAYAAFPQLPSSNSPSTATSSSASADAGTGAANGTAASGSPIASDWSSLGQALQSGNLTTAQEAFSKLGQDLQAAVQGAGHHHHHGHAMDRAQAVYSAMQASNSTAASAATPKGATGPADSVSADINALKPAFQSGNSSSAQDLLAKLEQNLRASGQFFGHRQGGLNTQSPAAT